jgi:serine/threonine-protein kinase
MRSQGAVVIGGRYELVERVAEGGMAIVWKGRVQSDAGFSRSVAVKEIKAEYRELRKYIQMFIEEARIGTELAHPHIVQVLDFLLEGDTYYLVLEWVEGVDLNAFVRGFSYLKQPVPWPLALAATVGALQGLGAAHQRIGPDGKPSPVVHRDISPHNILLSTSGTVKLGDFGLARARDRAFALTAPGMLKGKLCYLAPETVRGRGSTVATDQFSMGSVLWEVLAGERLFECESDMDVVQAIRNGDIKDLSSMRGDLPKPVIDAVNKALSLAPEDRFPSALAFAAELSENLRLLGGGLFDAGERLAAAVHVARSTLDELEHKQTISPSQMNQATQTLQLNFDSANFAGPTTEMEAQSPPVQDDD